MGEVLFKMVQRCWEGEVIPSTWDTAIIVPIPKTGDLTECDNYRGISLIACAAKLIARLVNDRLYKALESRGDLNRGQAGFRHREECIGQVAALHEIVQRRHNIGFPTYAAFIDFRKAYDTVPHEALLAKLDAIGVRGRMLGLVRALYADPKLKVRTSGNRLTEAVTWAKDSVRAAHYRRYS